MAKKFKNQVSQNKKEEKIEVEGKVVEVLKGSDYLVELPNGFTVKAYVSGKMRVNMIRILPGDTVTIEYKKGEAVNTVLSLTAVEEQVPEE